MSLSDDDFPTAIAAVAFAIASLEEEDSRHHKRTIKISGSSQTTTKSKKEDETVCTVHSKIFTKKTTEAEQRMMDDETSNSKNAENTLSGVQTFQKPPIFTAAHQNEHGSMTYKSGKEMGSGEQDSSTIKQTPSLPRKVKWDDNLLEYSKVEADWENKELTQIRNQYEKRNVSILEWESEKKTKAKRQMEQKEQGLQQRRAKDMQEYHDEVAWVDKVAREARALADERKRNDESKARKKALAMRSTSKTFRTCFCF